ncbi:BT_3044 domain-containing protein [Dysgonomonas sp. Marseille-P4361]|uniref:BT_3044 domain-containing protein n=1 Tax=Dysgonomonas sp. Marseille-P4361 TaxID=2161820 RepID=UPI000D56055F|nr:DUF4361 domain-containing protein [Dysgonomonas sp. Marseille-P4361]
MKYKKIIKSLLLVALVSTVLSCNKDEVFEREQYKNVIALLSDDGFNIFSEEIDLSEESPNGYISASCGGALPITEPVQIEIIEDKNLIDAYNLSNFDTEAERYAIYLDKDRYNIDNSEIIIPAGERGGRMKIQLNVLGLSPDSTYLIPFKANTISAYEMNIEKSTILYRIFLKNYYASTKSGYTYYNHKGVKDGISTMLQKPVFPVAKNEVRTFAGIKQFQSEEKLINQWSIKLVVGEDNKVTILPWNTSQYGIKINQIDDDPLYPNIFFIEDTGYKTFKTFLLRYDYVDPDDKKTYRMQEELRLEFNEREE